MLHMYYGSDEKDTDLIEWMANRSLNEAGEFDRRIFAQNLIYDIAKYAYFDIMEISGEDNERKELYKGRGCTKMLNGDLAHKVGENIFKHFGLEPVEIEM